MPGRAISTIAPRLELCIFCAVRLGRASQPPRCQGFNGRRGYRASAPSKRPPAVAYAVPEDDPDESPRPFQPPSSSPKAFPSAWPTFIPKRPVSQPVEPVIRPPEETSASPEPSNWKCPACGNINVQRRNRCVSCNEPKLGRPDPNQTEKIPKSQLRWGEFSHQGQILTRQRPAQGTQPQQASHFGRRISEADAQGPTVRHIASEKWSNLDGALPNQGRDRTDRLRPPQRTEQGYRYQETGMGERSPIARSMHQEPLRRMPVPPLGAPVRSPDQSFQNRVKQANRIRNSDTGDRSGLDALLKHITNTKKPLGPSRDFNKAESRARTSRVVDSMPQESTNFHLRSDVSQVSQLPNVVEDIVPWLPANTLEPGLSVGDEDLSRGGKERRRTGLQPRHEEAGGEASTRPRGRFQSDLDEPQVAETTVGPRQAKRTTRRALSRGSNYAMEDPDEELLSGRRTRKKKSKDKNVAAVPARTPVQLPEFISVKNLAAVLRVRTEDFISRMEDMGFERPRQDHVLDAETSGLIASEFHFEPMYNPDNQVEDLVARPAPANVTSLPPRPPIVTIMGHVDHGKTTILDWLRKSSVADSEHGGITQHIGAFSVAMPGGKQITFLDTPGHAAFLDMRRRGANVTDIVILVVAADDSVKPQTLEAIKHATDAKVPLIVAINKVDKEDADVGRVKQDLARHGITVEDYGGEVQAISVSGKFGRGMEDLEEATVTLSELLDHRAELDGLVEGWIIESKVTVAGRVATVLVRRGTLRPGDIIVAGTTWARIRTLRNDAGILVDEAFPGTPVQIDGWRGDDPVAGWEVLQAEDEGRAKDVMELRQEREKSAKLAGDTAAINSIRAEEAEARARVLAWEAEQSWASKRASRRPKDNAGWVEGKASGGPKQVHFVVKADVSGSVEAVVNSVSAIGNNEIAANVIRSGVGVINESDVQHLASSGEVGYLISFNQPVDASVARLARAAGLAILDHTIIYKVTDAVKEKLTAELPPAVTQRVVGEAEILKVFAISVKKGTTAIAGCKISNGTVSRDKKVRVLRGNKVVYDGKVGSLKNVKKDVAEMRKGSECGMGFEDWEGFQEGDHIQCYEEQKTPRTL